VVDTGNQAIRTLVGRLERELRACTPEDLEPQVVSLLTHSGHSP
jgi:hypothetical protein